jgi:hypothetical protein
MRARMMCMLLFLGALKLGCRHSFKPVAGILLNPLKGKAV